MASSFCNMLLQLRRRPPRHLTRAFVTKPSVYGQPFKGSHPHLVNNVHDITPGISLSEYQTRRKRLMDSLPDNSLVVCVAAPIKYMSKNIFYKYRQSSDFWYLTGFEQPDSALILEKTSSSQGYRMTLFSAPKDPAKEKWDGARTSFPDIQSILGADEAFPLSQLTSTLRSLLKSSSREVYADIPDSPSSSSTRWSTRRSTTEKLNKYLTSSSSLSDVIPPSQRHDLAPRVASLREIKSPAELALMHEAATISSRAHAKTMRFAQPGLPESSLAAHFEYICALQGSQRPAYVPVVASGGNALVIHYTANNHVLQPDELVLIDAGCEFNGYASDITRTFPSSGHFTPAQKDLYIAILSVQKQLITYCFQDANITMSQLHHLSVQLLKEALNQIGFGLGKENDLEKVLYPHYLSHPIGIDLHESKYFNQHLPLKEGNVITIEPGIYVPPTSNFPKHFHNFGIRIEDEVYVGKEHPIVLSSSAPKEIEDIEGACQGLLGFEPY